MNKIGSLVTLTLFMVAALVGCDEKNLSKEDLLQFQRAQSLFIGKKFAESEKVLTPLLEKRPGHLESVVLLSKIKIYTRNYAEAESLLRAYLEDDEENPYALMWLGRLLALQEPRREEAVEIFKKIVHKDPENYLAHYYLARFLEKENRMKEALQEYRAALAMEQELGRMHLHIGSMMARLNMKDQAELHYNRSKMLVRGMAPASGRVSGSTVASSR
jgi:predicted Zn-dependent protease